MDCKPYALILEAIRPKITLKTTCFRKQEDGKMGERGPSGGGGTPDCNDISPFIMFVKFFRNKLIHVSTTNTAEYTV